MSKGQAFRPTTILYFIKRLAGKVKMEYYNVDFWNKMEFKSAGQSRVDIYEI
jgi:hypothetical protein